MKDGLYLIYRLQELFSYNSDTGSFIYKTNARGRKAGREVGCGFVRKGGQVMVRLIGVLTVSRME